MSSLAAALPLHTAGPYVAGAYIAVFVIVLVYVAIMGAKLARSERTLRELVERLQQREVEREE